MIIFGIDPGLASTGFGVIRVGRRPVLSRCGHISTSSKEHVARRLSQIHSDIEELINRDQPDVMAIENIFSMIRYPRAGILLGTVAGVIYLAAGERGIPITEVTPKEVKSSLVGNGNASKSQIREAARRILGITDINSFHAADAIAVALTAHYRNHPHGMIG